MTQWSVEQATEQLQRALARLHVPFDPVAFRWEGLVARAYKEHVGDAPGMGWRGVLRFDLGRPPALPAQFALRYFEIEPEGYSSLEKHTHIHLVVVVRGRGKALVGTSVFDLQPLEVVYVPPEVPHRWLNPYAEPFGFLCVVDAERDRPRPVSPEEWETLRTHPDTAPWVF